MKYMLVPFLILFCSVLCLVGGRAWREMLDKGVVGDADTLQERVHSMLTENCGMKDELIDLNGGWARLMGYKRYNGIIKGHGDMLFPLPRQRVETRRCLHSLLNLYQKCCQNECEFLYVQLPLKMNRMGDMLPDGCGKDYSHEMVDDFLSNLRQLAIPTYDTRGGVDADFESVQRYFFRTDHHWNFDGAMKVFYELMMKLQQILELPSSVVAEKILPRSWKRMAFPRCFLGSWGRRVGALYAGKDEVYYYLPSFETQIRKRILSRDVDVEGPFEESVIFKDVIPEPKSHFRDYAYGLYGGDYDLVRYESKLAPCDKHILIVKDSFSLPIVAWMTTVFREVDVVDLRYYNPRSVCSFIEREQFDLVLVMYNPGALGAEKMWNFGSGSRAVCQAVEEDAPNNISIQERDGDYNNVVVARMLKPNGRYRVMAKRANANSPGIRFLGLALYDRTKRKIAKRTTVGLDDVDWEFTVPNDRDRYDLLVYAGKIGATSGIAIEVEGLRILRFEDEDKRQTKDDSCRRTGIPKKGQK